MRSAVFSLIFVLTLILNFAPVVSSQTPEFDVDVPEQVMQQVVRRVLVYSFKPRSKPMVVSIAEQGIKSSWLPKIKNVEFRLLSDEEIQRRDLELYFFTKPNYWRNKHNIGFAFGEPHCVFSGNNWRFSFQNQQVKLWQKYGVGGGCSSGGDF